VEVDHSVSVECEEAPFCDHTTEDDGSCTVIHSNQSKLDSAIVKFNNLLEK
jgi:hypothetical protein